MTRNDGVDTRKQRIQAVIQKICALIYANKDQGSEIALDRALADLQYDLGLTERRILEYAAIGEKRGLYVIDTKRNQIRKAES